MLLNIEKLVYGGDGIARLPPDDRGRGKAVFIPFVLDGENIRAELTENKPGFARARATSIVQASRHRVAAACPYFSQCGGCQYQHASYERQLKIKEEILRENLRRMAKLELSCEIQVHPSPPWNYRNRSRLQLRTQPQFALGYFKFASHQLLPIEECPISSPLVNRGIAELWKSGQAGRAVEGVREIEFFANADDTQMLLELLCAPEARRASVRAWAEDLCAALPEIAGVAAFREPQKGVQEPLVTVGRSDLTYQTRKNSYQVSAGSFFQTNRFLVDQLVDIVTSKRSGDLALDLYAGVGLFSTALACDFRHIVSVESSQTSGADLKYNLPATGKAMDETAEQYLGVARPETVRAGGRSAAPGKGSAGRPPRELKDVGAGKSALPQSFLSRPDLIVVDPPRAGLGDSVARALAAIACPRITYASCDPATLARDLVPLVEAGYRVDEVHLVDLFPQTYHLESVVQLVR